MSERPGFSDHFSGRAAAYAAFRPRQPEALLAWAAALAPGRELAWDCGTGSGQAAVGLAAHFARVIATDASAAQLAHAAPHERVSYRVALAESSGLPDASVELVTAAQALHWFDIPAFFREAQRVLVPRGAIAVWAYGDARLDDPALAAILRHHSETTVGPCWPAERRLIHDAYRSFDFPFAEVAAPPFTLEARWTLAELAGYVRSWSATARFVAAEGRDPTEELERALAPGWGGVDARRTVWWPMVVRAGRVA